MLRSRGALKRLKETVAEIRGFKDISLGYVQKKIQRGIMHC